MRDLISTLAGEMRAVVRGLALLILVALATWPLGGPFHTLHAVLGLLGQLLAWTGAPSGGGQ